MQFHENKTTTEKNRCIHRLENRVLDSLQLKLLDFSKIPIGPSLGQKIGSRHRTSARRKVNAIGISVCFPDVTTGDYNSVRYL